MPHYVRADIPGGTFFFTVALLERRRRLLVENIATLREAFRGVRHRYPFTIDAIVILPDHLHCVWTLPAADADFSTRWRLIKAAFARGIAAGERLSERRQRTGERGIWQRRFWEHAIRDAADLTRHVDYIHHNPVKHGHADRVVDWPYSSFHRYVERGTRQMKKLRESLTYDRGSEMAQHEALARRLKLTIWFADPHAPWQRGSHEKTNGLLRQFLPKGTDLFQASQTQLNDIARLLNGRPRQTLDWQTPEEVMAQEIRQFRQRDALDS